MEHNLRLLGFMLMAFMAALMTVTAYKNGYNRALADAQCRFDTGVEGYCLADSPPHPGPCNG